ncbi:reductive dehalogenase [Dehalogenimonas etheniformans]|uniref:Reductive dehalogenase n=1 Tax=Dehalogenimonas etheniformans TaxID=1536648 RepID=A0A2P5P7P8_9CHLR|nr:reductive dehalogenase [Dehalogenimonas etheniformans]PPD58322.1 reductive dehalogenase [Dehalogenimonas etheniformans]QNT75559.1 reductive dehalogenase [Dehalogenimonas etheniformans]
MSIFHSTVTRRDFMKGLGLTATGAAALVSPSFHDLDELTASDSSKPKRAWWVKEIDEPTVEIDWSIMKRGHGGHSTQSAAVVARYPGLDAYNDMNKTEKSDIDRLKDNEPGYQLRDSALSGGNNIGRGALGDTASDLKFGQVKAKTPEQLGVPKWTGSPEEATKMLRAAMMFYGSSAIATSEINEHHQKLIGLTGENQGTGYMHKEPPTTSTKPLVFYDKPNFSFDSKTGISYLPNVPLYGITWLQPQNPELNRLRPTTLGRLAQTRYRLREVPRACTQAFVMGLGYESMLDEPYRGIPSNAGAVLGGLAENARHSIMAISPEVGAFGGYFDLLTTLPVEPTKPINAGIWRFCQSCGFCADKCPSESITKVGEAEPSWEVRPSKTNPVDKLTGEYWSTLRQDAGGEFHKMGRKTLWTDMPTCQLYVRSVATCNVCWGNCVFNGANGAMIHNVVKGTVSATSLFNGFFAAMYPNFGYGVKEGAPIEDWWDLVLPSYGFDSTMYTTHMGY